jgi:hypothetical protein
MSIYDPLYVIRNAAEMRLNGLLATLQPITGRLIKNDQAFTQQVFNNAWRRMQEFFASMKYSGLQQDTAFLAVPAILGTDPISQVLIGYNGYTDTSTNPPTTSATPALPSNLIRPYQIWERQSGTANDMTEIDMLSDALPKVRKWPWNRQCHWEDDTLVLPGATEATDIAMEYQSFFPDFVNISANPGPNQVIGQWYMQPVPILRCQDAFADYVCREIFYARGDMDAVTAIEALAQANAKQLAARDSTEGEAIYKTSEFGKMRGPYTPTEGGPKSQIVKR